MWLHLSCEALQAATLTQIYTPNTDVTIQADAVVFTTAERFLSWTMDAGETGHWGRERAGFWYNARVRSLARPKEDTPHRAKPAE